MRIVGSVFKKCRVGLWCQLRSMDPLEWDSVGRTDSSYFGYIILS